jgi:hypothetical protein
MFHKFSWRHVLIVRLLKKKCFSYHWSQYWFHLFSHQKGSYLKYLDGKIRVSFIAPPYFFVRWEGPYRFSPKRFRCCDPLSVTRQTTPASLTFSDTFASVSSLVASQALWREVCVFFQTNLGMGPTWVLPGPQIDLWIFRLHQWLESIWLVEQLGSPMAGVVFKSRNSRHVIPLDSETRGFTEFHDWRFQWWCPWNHPLASGKLT